VLGRFDTLKGTDLLVEALPRILNAEPHRKVLIAGGLPDHLKAERRWLEALRSACDTDRLVFTGWLSLDAVRETLANAALFIAPSRLETCGLALMEALAASCPIVATDIPAHRELAQHAALLVPADGASIAEGALALLTDVEAAERLGAGGPDRLPDPAQIRAEWLHFWAETR
jgi:phosphatidylinositol alpha-mannosyltransferase